MQVLTRVLVKPYRWLIPLFGVLSAFITLPELARSVGSLATAAVMAPLDIRNDDGMQEFQRLLGEAKAIGVDTVSVDL